MGRRNSRTERTTRTPGPPSAPWSQLPFRPASCPSDSSCVLRLASCAYTHKSRQPNLKKRSNRQVRRCASPYADAGPDRANATMLNERLFISFRHVMYSLRHLAGDQRQPHRGKDRHRDGGDHRRAHAGAAAPPLDAGRPSARAERARGRGLERRLRLRALHRHRSPRLPGEVVRRHRPYRPARRALRSRGRFSRTSSSASCRSSTSRSGRSRQPSTIPAPPSTVSTS
jgi:hypothetical protein